MYKKKKTHAYNSLATFRLKKVKVRINSRLEAAHKIIMEISLLIMEKSWNFYFEFLWEPCLRRRYSLSSSNQKVKIRGEIKSAPVEPRRNPG